MGAIKSVFEKSITLSEDERKTFMQNSQKLSETVFNKEKIIDKLLALTVGDRK